MPRQAQDLHRAFLLNARGPEMDAGLADSRRRNKKGRYAIFIQQTSLNQFLITKTRKFFYYRGLNPSRSRPVLVKILSIFKLDFQNIHVIFKLCLNDGSKSPLKEVF
jgi:hypothetical protein